MSRFNGQLNLYPEICVDKFDSARTNIRCFILTHFHDDHMTHLDDWDFYTLLLENAETQFICSSVTKHFISVVDKYSHLRGVCRGVQTESPFFLKISDKESVTITLVGSGHCPGSVMALIEGPRGNVLCTGDFRLPVQSASRLSFLQDKVNFFQD